jgi:hypothetical protein
MKIFLIGLTVGIIFGFAGGFFTEGQFHPDFFVLATVLSYVIILSIEVRKAKVRTEANQQSKKAS